MRMAGLFLALVALTARTAWAQQEATPATQDGPMIVPPAKAQAAAASAPVDAVPVDQDAPAVPDSDGVYSRGAGLVLPRLWNAAPVIYPQDAPAADPPRVCRMSMVIGADGVPAGIKVIRSLNSQVDQAAMNAIANSHFGPGTLDGEPVPVRIDVILRFVGNGNYAFPRVLASGPPRNLIHPRPFDTPPKAIHTVEAEFSDKARRAKLSGVVLIQMTVNEDGFPTDVHVTRSLGMGLDEKAVQAVRQYRFKPATKDGKPVAATISVEISFHLYDRPGE